MTSAASLGELRTLLDSVLSGSLDPSASLKGAPRENPHAIQEELGVDADGTAVQPPRPDHPARRKTRDLTAALADLLLNAATIKCDESISDAHREVEDASEAND